ncbi:juvenile hormone esterase-like [Vanessa atalanta]|uniref:juvenile hormone esterase-like n=1 Tax=Vanessa atalanta TaxID=42275 RepID=UPI001FCD3B98|nr:juvenile hormone esterase-like [Vanessa atalanta]
MTTQGIVRGYYAPHPPHYTYLGIPYARPHTRYDRFKSSVVAERDSSWKIFKHGVATRDCVRVATRIVRQFTVFDVKKNILDVNSDAVVRGAPRLLRDGSDCEVSAHLQSGWVCGVHRVASNTTHFASFLGVPYAAQPLGERRFRELEPVEPWDDFYDASNEGPICPQHDIFYGPLLGSANMSEACISANIHVPLDALPGYETPTPDQELLPVIVFVHGGGFAFGSGGISLHGPEYLMHKDVIVITFNYRLNVFGFLSLNSSSIPGNNGLRDIVTLLRWVQTNAQSFGGDPNNVTLAGQSAGASCAHLLSLSNVADGLFHRLILMSGTSTSYFTTSPAYAQVAANLFLSNLGINATDPEVIHQQLIDMPLQDIMEANKQTQDQNGIVAFLPVVESSFPGVTAVLEDDPDVLMSNGRGKNIPLIVGFTTAECEAFRPNFEGIDILSLINESPQLILSPNLLYKVPTNVALDLAQRVKERYFNGTPTMDKFIKSCSDSAYVYPAMKLAEKRVLMQGAPVFLYQYSYEADFNVMKEAKGLSYEGATHVEDLTFVFRANAMEGVQGFSPPTQKDKLMAKWMTMFFKNFSYCNDPTCNQLPQSNWPAVEEPLPVQYQNINMPMSFSFTELTNEQQDMVQFFDSLENSTSQI